MIYFYKLMTQTPLPSSPRQRSLLLLLALTLLIQTSNQTCGEGCISCRKDPSTNEPKCMICDLFNFYAKSFDGTCEQKIVENCEVASLDRFLTPCLLCQPNYVLDKVQGKCISVNFSQEVADCLRYSENSNCVSCMSGHYISNGKCFKSETEVKDCLYYSGEGVCMQCLEKRFLDKELNECFAFPKAVGCQQYSNLRCDQCKHGFDRDLNFYMRREISPDETQKISLDLAKIVEVSESADDNCFPLKISNCKEYESSDACLKCEENYFVNEHRKCEKFPQKPISNCKVYSDPETCVECDVLFKLKDKKCVRRTPVEKCVKYDTQSDLCLECAEGYYYKNNTSCVKRTKIHSDCEKYRPTYDVCEKCKDDYVYEFFFYTCMKPLENCKSHEVKQPNGNEVVLSCQECHQNYFPKPITSHISLCEKKLHQPFCKTRFEDRNACEVCQNGYFNDNGVCKIHSVDFCRSYEDDRDECRDCIEGFTKVDGLCQSIQVNNCYYPAETFGECEKCMEDFYLNEQKQCVLRNLVGCAEPKEKENKCEKCYDGYYKDNDDELCYVNTEPNCDPAEMKKGVCRRCVTGYTLTQYGTCNKQLSNPDYCSSFEGKACKQCSNPNTYFLEPILGQCIVRNNTNCLEYDLYSDTCTKCNASKYLVGGQCEDLPPPGPGTDQCSSIKDGKNECVSCNIGYYLDSLSKRCWPNMLDNCTTPQDNSKFGCSSCDEGYYLNPETLLCEKTYIPDCILSGSKGLCLACKAGFSQINGVCHKENNLGCYNYSSPQNDDGLLPCLNCSRGFYLKDDKCHIQNISNCKVFSNNTNTCATCVSGYILSADGLTCVSGYIPNCVEIEVIGGNPPRIICATCESMYYKKDDKCSRVTTPHCVESDGKSRSSSCTMCEPGFKISGDNCVPISISSDYHDPHCKGNNTSTDIACSVCKNNFEMYNTEKMLFRWPLGCLQNDSTNIYKCTHCIRGYELTPEGKCRVGPTDSVCLLAWRGYTGGLAKASDDGECQHCRDVNTHYYVSGEKKCKERKRVYGCEAYNTSGDACSTCHKGFNKVESGPSRITCVEGTAANGVQNCAVYDMTNPTAATCKYCKNGYGNSNCAPGASYFSSDSPFGDFSSFYSDFSLSTNFGFYDLDFINDNDSILKDPTTKYNFTVSLDNEKVTNYNITTQSYEINSLHMAITTFKTLDSLTFKNGNITDCLYSYENGVSLFCLACRNGKTGRTQFDPTEKVIYYTECVDPSPYGLLKQYSGVGYLDETVSLQVPNNMFLAVAKSRIEFDSCSNGGILVYYLYYYLENPLKTFPMTFPNKKMPMECVHEIHPDNQVENCQIYGYFGQSPDDEPDLVYSGNPLSRCLACKPGYYGWKNPDDTNLAYSKCLPIENCDMESSENTMMNACNKCKSGFAWGVFTPLLRIQMHKCVPANDNCQVYNSDANKCRMCLPGFTLNDSNDCVQISEINCVSPGILLPEYLGFDLKTETNKDTKFDFLNHYYLALKNSSNSASLHCSQCKSGYLPMVDTTNSYQRCVYDPSFDLEGCVQYSAKTSSAKCVKCEEDFLLDVPSGTCVKDSPVNNFEHCEEINGNPFLGGKVMCSKCKEDYTIHFSAYKCSYNPNCTEIIIGICSHCKEGFFLDKQSSMCIPNPEDSTCKSLFMYLDEASNILHKYCFECKEPGMIAINSKSRFTEEEADFKCVENTFNFPNVVAPVLFEDFDPDLSKHYNDFGVSDITNHKITITKTTSSFFRTSTFCGPVFGNKKDCDEYNESTKECDKCRQGFFSYGGQCRRGQIPLCLEYQAMDSETDPYDHRLQTCSKCVETAYLAKATTVSPNDLATNQCVAYTVHCETYDPAYDQCITCPPLYFLEKVTTPVSKFKCSPYTVSDCKIFHPTEDLCLICAAGFFMNSSNICMPITKPNCAIYSNYSDECTFCNQGFYLTLGGQCLPHSVWNCRVYSNIKDECVLCENGFYLNPLGKCVENSVTGCRTPKSNVNECSMCAEGYYLDLANSICKPYSARHCSAYNGMSDSCLVCDASSYMSDDGTCMEYSSALNCLLYHPDKDQCIKCIDGFYLSDDNQCLQHTSDTCLTYNPTKNECTSCPEMFFLDVDNNMQCKPLTVKNCKEVSSISNRCTECHDSYYLDIESGNCSFYSVQNCQLYHPYQNKCASCEPGYYLNTDFTCAEYTVSGCSSFALDADACLACKKGFFLNRKERKCYAYTAKNCVSYKLEKDECSSCLPGFYLGNGICKWYTVKNCVKYDAIADRCNGCITGFFHYAGKCMEYSVKNCLVYKSEDDECEECLPGHYKEYGKCFAYTAENCKSFDPSKDLCEECESLSTKHFRNQENQLCEKYTEIDNCKEYKDDSDKCKTCKEGYFLEGEICRNNPEGIPDCEIYASKEMCQKCMPGYYIQNHICMEPKKPIPHCHYYSSELFCAECSPTFILTSDFKCEKTLTQGCKTWSDANNCATCPGNNVLKKNNMNHNICAPSMIENCKEPVGSAGGVTCKLCETGYFLSEEHTKCVWPKSLIDNCREYSDHGVCSRCEDNFLLDKHNTKCTSDIQTVGPNCMVGHISDRPKCSRCEGGYYFDKTGVCQPCSKAMEGCALCDIDNLSQCLICSKNYYMNEDMKCVKYPPPPVPVGVHVIKVLVMGMVGLMLVK